MTNFLIKLFVKDNEKTEDIKVRMAYGKFSSIVGIICNVILFVGKMAVGVISGSVAIIADAVNNLSDASSSVISLLGFKLASKPADEEHPYGHGRYEYLSGLIVSVLILVIGVELLKESVSKVITPSEIEFSFITVGVLVGSIILKLWMMLFNRNIGKRINSQALLATSADSRNDVIATSAVLVATFVSHYTSFELDGWIGVAVALFILYSGVGLVKDTIDPILGRAPSEEFVRHIHDTIVRYPGVLGTHDLMIHDYGPGRVFASVHVEMAAEGDVLESHDVLDNIERDFLKNDGLHITVHFDPISTEDDGTTANLRSWIAEKIKLIDPRLTIHDLRIVDGPTHTNVIFDCVAPHDIGMTDGELKAAISVLVRESYENYYCVITVEHSYSPMPH